MVIFISKLIIRCKKSYTIFNYQSNTWLSLFFSLIGLDWIGFNIQGFVEKKQIKQIAEYLFQNFGFNSIFAVGLGGKEEALFKDPKNNYQVSFRLYRYSDIYWDGIKIDFSGNNAVQVYNLIKEQKFDWNIFQLSNLSLS